MPLRRSLLHAFPLRLCIDGRLQPALPAYRKIEMKASSKVAMARRDRCRKLGINPYTTNATLQARLESMSRAMCLAEVPFKLGEATADPLASAIAVSRGSLNPAMAALIYG